MDSFDQAQNKRARSTRDKTYNEYVEQKTPPTNLFQGCFRAFWTGGLICTIGQVLIWLFETYLGAEFVQAAGFASIILVIIAATFTGLGVYDVIGKYAGAGSVVPITGFSNSIVSPAMEYKREGYIMGVGAKMFTIAGPVLVYGIGSSVIYGILYLIFHRG